MLTFICFSDFSSYSAHRVSPFSIPHLYDSVTVCSIASQHPVLHAELFQFEPEGGGGCVGAAASRVRRPYTTPSSSQSTEV